MIKILEILVVIGLIFAGLVFYSPDRRGWKSFGSLQKFLLVKYDAKAVALPEAIATTILSLEVMEEPKYNWPISRVTFPPYFDSNHDLTYLVKANVFEQFGTPISISSPVAIETHGTLHAKTSYILSLDSNLKIIDGYEVDAPGTVRLIDTTQKTAKGTFGNPMTEPMQLSEAAKQLLGKAVVRIPTKFWP